MTAIREYLMGILAVSLICGIAVSLLEGSGSEKLIRFVCGIVMAVSILMPFGRGVAFPEISLPDLSAADTVTRDALDWAEALREERITDELETYIENKAAVLGYQVNAQITLSREELPVPVAVTVYGEISGPGKEALSNILQKDLGIAKEDQRWNQTDQ